MCMILILFLTNILFNLPSLLRACAYREYCQKSALASYLVVTHKVLLMLEMEILCCKGNSDYKEWQTISIQSQVGSTLGSAWYKGSAVASCYCWTQQSL